MRLRLNKVKVLAAIVLMAFSAVLMLAGCVKENLEPFTYPENAVKIKELVLNCSNKEQFDRQAFFWKNLMGFDVDNQSQSSFSVKIGTSILTFVVGAQGGVYQFTLEIPENQIENALFWIKKRAKVVPDAQTGAEILHKSKLNTHSLFFNDPAGNHIELIARHKLKNSMQGEFNRNMIYSISNVTVVTRSIKDCKDSLINNFNLYEIPGTSNSVKIVGGESGTLTFHIPTRPYFPSEDNIASPYRMNIVIRHPSQVNFKLPGSEAIIRSEP
jgi:hypothetical protein